MDWAKSKTALGIVWAGITTVLLVNGWVDDTLAKVLYSIGAMIFGVGAAHKYQKRTDAIANGSK